MPLHIIPNPASTSLSLSWRGLFSRLFNAPEQAKLYAHTYLAHSVGILHFETHPHTSINQTVRYRVPALLRREPLQHTFNASDHPILKGRELPRAHLHIGTISVSCSDSLARTTGTLTGKPTHRYRGCCTVLLPFVFWRSIVSSCLAEIDADRS